MYSIWRGSKGQLKQLRASTWSSRTGLDWAGLARSARRDTRFPAANHRAVGALA